MRPGVGSLFCAVAPLFRHPLSRPRARSRLGRKVFPPRPSSLDTYPRGGPSCRRGSSLPRSRFRSQLGGVNSVARTKTGESALRPTSPLDPPFYPAFPLRAFKGGSSTAKIYHPELVSSSSSSAGEPPGRHVFAPPSRRVCCTRILSPSLSLMRAHSIAIS